MHNTAHKHQIVEQARCFADEYVRPLARTFDEEGRLPKSVIRAMAERHFLLASLPEQYGGLGLDPIQYGLLTEAIGKACCSTVGLITVENSLVGETLLRWGSDGQKDRWLRSMASGEKIGAFALSEPTIGSDANSVKTTYNSRQNGFVLNGRKKWISFGDIADFFIVVAACGDEKTAFIVERDTPGLYTRPIQGMLARRASHIAEVILSEVYVPKSNIIGRLGSGFSYVVGTALDHGRYSVAWASVATAQEAVEAMVTYARNRRQFNKRLCEFQLIQGMIGDAVTKVHAARALCMGAGELRLKNHPEAMVETTMAKYYASRVAAEITQDALQVHGANGCANEYPVERLFREARAFEIIEGTSQIQQQIIAKYGLRRYRRR